MNALLPTLLILFLSLISQSVAAADSIYICRNGIYENRLLSAGLELTASDLVCDSVVFSRPTKQLKVDFAEFAQSHTVNTVFIMSNDEKKLATNKAMAPYAASSSTASDIIRIDVATGQRFVETPLSILTNLTNGLTITLKYDGSKFFSITDSTLIKTRQNNYVHRYTFSEAKARQNNWLATIPSKVRLNMLTLPGAHDAATGSVTTGMAKTQSLSIGDQLAAGVRAFDLRPRYNASSEADIQLENLEIYHGIIGTGVKWKDAMDVIINYLKENPTETVFINLQKEDASGSNDYSSTWRTSIRSYLLANKAHVLQKITTTTSLSDCRGKVVVVSHNPYGPESSYYGTVYGGLTASWEDDATFTTTINYTNSTAICQATITDNYNATNTSTKQDYIRANLDAANSDKSTRWYYTFMNVAWKLFGSNPSTYAKTHNAYVHQLLQSATYDSRLGFVFYDFCGDPDYTYDLLPALILQNHKYLY
jgi:hypothetical protein